jgi:hypothetical protein
MPCQIHPNDSNRVVTMKQDQRMGSLEMLVGMARVVHVTQAARFEQDRAANRVIRLPLIDSAWSPECVRVALRCQASTLASATDSSLQVSRGSAAARANVHSRTRSASTPRRSATLWIVASGALSIRPSQLKRCCVAS